VLPSGVVIMVVTVLIGLGPANISKSLKMGIFLSKFPKLALNSNDC